MIICSSSFGTGGLTCNIQKGLAFCMLRGRVSVVPLEHIVWPLYCGRFWPFTCIFFYVFCGFLEKESRVLVCRLVISLLSVFYNFFSSFTAPRDYAYYYYSLD